MRPVNLIPPEARRGDRAPMRVGSVSYVVLGALALGLLGAIALGFTSKQVSDREAEASRLEGELQEATARAESLSSFAQFRAVQESRAGTVASLAESRFDWERVLNELALVIPSDVWLIELGGSVSPAVEVENAPDVSIRSSVPGPALSMVGCATGQEAVARFIADLEDIDGVTRVGVASSELGGEDAQAGGGSAGPAAASDSGQSSGGDCRTREFISRFEVVIAFDSVPVPETATTAPSVPAPVAPEGSGEGEGELAEAPSGETASSEEAPAAGTQATNVPSGG